MNGTTEGTVQVFTFKEGLLSSVAHDLRLGLKRFELTVNGDTLTVRFWPESLEVDGPMKNGQLDAGGLSAKDRRDIHENIVEKILHTARNPEGRFEGRITPGEGPVRTATGTLTLHGQSQPLSVTARVENGRAKGEVDLVPTKWGIAPYKALMGAIKLQDRVRVSFDVKVG